MYNLQELIASTSDITLLYVEDNKQARESTLPMLSEFFQNIIVGVDGKDGLEKFETNSIDLIITDINMPQLNGLDMISLIRENDKNVPIILFSAYSDIEYFKRSVQLGVDGYLLKPLNVEQFLELIHKVVEKLDVQKKLAETLHFLKQYESIANENTLVSKTDTEGIITYANDMFCEVSQYTREELVGQNQNIIRHVDNPPSMFEELWNTIKVDKKAWKGIIRNRAKDGSSYYVNAIIKPILDLNGTILEYIAMRHNITEIMSHKKQLLDYIQTAKHPFIVKIRIEDFDELQKYYGLSFTSNIEHKLSLLLNEHMPKNLHFEYFYFLESANYAFVKDIQETKDIQNTIDSLREFQKIINAQHIQVDSILYDVSINICISYEENVYENVKYGMKKLVENKENFLVANSIAKEVHSVARKNLMVLTQVKEALENERIVSYFQPIVDKNQKIVKYESLVRLVESDGSVLAPYFFLDIAKKGKYYTQITAVVLKNSFKVLQSIDVDVTINLSAIDIENEELREVIYKQLESCGANAKRVTFELLEDEEMKDFEVIKSFIRRVKAYGVSIAIDDFGSGYSNYERVLDFQPDIIKIDGSLIKNIVSSDFSTSIVHSVILFAKDQNLKVVAEYVENESIYNKLKELDVDYFQGYYFGKPAKII